jgi:hypothetical protein
MTDYTKLEKEVNAQADVICDMAFREWELPELGNALSHYDRCRHAAMAHLGSSP